MIIRQSTARTILVGPVLDSDGAAKTNEVVANIRVTKNGTVGSAHGSTTLTHDHAGKYKLAMNAGDSDTVGVLEISLNSGTNDMPVKTINVVEEAVFDGFYAASAVGPSLASIVGTPVNLGSGATIADNLDDIAGPDFQTGTGVTDDSLRGISEAINGTPNINITQISGDSGAADNLKLQYDTGGLTGDTFPATQSQVGNIATGAGGLSALISAFAKVGAEPETNTFAATQQGDSTYHIVEDDTGNTDFYYQATVGAGGKATAFTWKGYVQSNGDSTSVWYWDWIATAYKQIDTLTGSNGTTPIEEVFLVPVGATGTGADQGKVRLRFLSTTTTAIATDRLLCEFSQASQSVGYANGQVWVDSNSLNTNTVSFVDGVADNVAGSWVNAVTISGQVGLTDFHVINGSTITLSGTSDNFSVFGDNWTLQLASRSVAGAYFQGAQVSGVSTSSSEVHFEGCAVATVSVQKGHFDFCSFSGTVTHTLAGDYNYHNCYSGVAGTGGPTFAKTAGQAITAQWRGWKGSINLTGLQVGDTLTIGGVELGTIDLGSPAGAVVVEIRGIYKDLVNVGSANVNLEGAINAADVSSAYAGPRGPGVYLNDAAANTNTVNGLDGTLLNPVSTIEAAKTITDSLGFKRVYLVNDSSDTLSATMEDYEFVGIGEMMANTINFGSQDVDNSAFHNLLLTGAQGGTGRCQAVGCVLSVITGMEITASGCVLADAGVLTLRDDCAFDGCFSAVAGSGTPTLNINSVASVNVYFRHYSGGLKITNAVATTVMSFEADGQIVVDATCTSLTIVLRGNLSITDNGTTTNITSDAAINRTNINTECDTALSDIKLHYLMGTDTSAAVGGDLSVAIIEGSILAHLMGYNSQGNAAIITNYTAETDSLEANATTLATVKTDTGNIVSRITATLFSGITSLAEWLGAMAGKQAPDSTARTEIRATGAGSGTFDPITDSLEEFRDSVYPPVYNTDQRLTGITSLAEWLGAMAGAQIGNGTALTEIHATGAGSGTYDEETDSLQGQKDLMYPLVSDVHSYLGTPTNLGSGATLAFNLSDIAGPDFETGTGITHDSLRGISEALAGLNDLSASDVNAQVLDVMNVDTFAEPGSVPAATASMVTMIHWMFTLSRNKQQRTSSAATLRNDANGGDIATATISDDGTTFTREEWS